MPRSYLNIITLDGREIRVAEFGFFADAPSFDGDSVIFRHGNEYKRISFDDGMITTAEAPAKALYSGRYRINLSFTSHMTNGIGYCEMILTDNKSTDERVLVRFMGSEYSIGENPLDLHENRIVFFGYPADEFGE